MKTTVPLKGDYMGFHVSLGEFASSKAVGSAYGSGSRVEVVGLRIT